MTVYAHRGSKIVATWKVGDSSVWEPTIELGADFAHVTNLICRYLTDASEALWNQFERPSHGPDERREDEESTADLIRRALYGTATPVKVTGGVMIVIYDPAVDAAIKLRQVIAELPETLAKHICSEVEKELEAVANAELGILVGRSRQAVSLSPISTSPTQVASAETLLRQEMIDELFTHVQATAACVAAASWLHAAADVLSDQFGVQTFELLEHADSTVAIDIDTATRVIDRIDNGTAPETVVAEILRTSDLQQQSPLHLTGRSRHRTSSTASSKASTAARSCSPT